MLLEEQINSIVNIGSRNLQTSDKYIDLSYLKTYTIDDQNAIEIDDAISIDYSQASPAIWIHIADPTYYFHLNTPLDFHVRNRATSLYLSEDVQSMFPESLISEVFSLLPGKRRLSLSARIILKDDG